MEIFLTIIGISIAVLAIYWYIKYKREREREQRELDELLRKQREEKRQQLIALFTKLAPKVTKANKMFEKLTSVKNGYLSNYQLQVWKSAQNKLFAEIDGQPYSNIQLDTTIVRSLDKFSSYYNQSDSLRSSFNNEFIASELKEYSSFFDNIEGRSLDEQQRSAVITDEDNCLIIAGAGTGKTTTIAGKVSYLINRYKIDPSEILLISFTNKSCDEMKHRIREKMQINIDVKTFHKLGLDIIREVEAKNQKDVCGLSRKELIEVFNSFFTSLIENETYLQKVTRYFTSYLKPYKADDEFNNEGERIQYLKDQNLFGFKKVQRTNSDGQRYEYRERLKSQEEVEIANFLFLNGIEYNYEERYKYRIASRTFGQYKPDFYLPEYEIYIEHFAINKQGKVPHWFKGDNEQSAQEKYTNGINWKRELHDGQGTKLVETYSWERREGKLLSNLQTKLEKGGVDFHPKSPEEIWEIISNTAEEDISNFVQLLFTFLNLLKSNNYTLQEVEKIINQEKEREVKERNQAFFELFEPILGKYETFLHDRDEIDFSDLINVASTHVNDKKYSSPFKYIIIDEFQDISIGRYNLIKSLLDSNPSCKLFCVGDDWQSIYRFTGSDIAIFTQFTDYFKSSPVQGFRRATELLYIETTYRFSDDLIDVTSKFILKNDNQLEKELTSHTEGDGQPYTLLHYNYDTISISTPVITALNDIIAREGNASSAKVLFLGRYNHDINPLKKFDTFSFLYDRSEEKYKVTWSVAPNLAIEYLTVHSAKGLEADYVVLLNGNSGKYGFPAEISDDPILNLLLTEADQFPNGEERRAFYVAMTRTKKHLYLIANEQIKSKFLVEIETREESEALPCPWCETGILQEKTGTHGDFYGCNNFPYCNYTQKITAEELFETAENKRDAEDYEAAIIQYTKTIKADKNLQDAYYGRAKCYEKLEKFTEAIEDYTSSIALRSDHYASYYWRASCKYDLKDYTGAARDWSKALRIRPEMESPFYWRGNAYKQLKKYEEAIQDYTVAIEKEPTNKVAFLERGQCHIALDDKASAWDDWQKAKELGYEYAETLLRKYKLTERPKVTKEIKVNGSFDDRLSAIKEAIQKEQMIKFNYRKSTSFADGSRSLRTIEPTEIASIGTYDSLCVKGYCHLRKQDRIFAIDRISNLIINPHKIETWEEDSDYLPS